MKIVLYMKCDMQDCPTKLNVGAAGVTKIRREIRRALASGWSEVHTTPHNRPNSGALVAPYAQQTDDKLSAGIHVNHRIHICPNHPAPGEAAA